MCLERGRHLYLRRLADFNDYGLHPPPCADNMGGEDDRRGDGYMEAYQPVVSQVPWLPVVGNHEFYDGDVLTRYLNQTEGAEIANPIGRVVGHPADHPYVRGASTTADSALGRMLVSVSL